MVEFLSGNKIYKTSFSKYGTAYRTIKENSKDNNKKSNNEDNYEERIGGLKYA